MSKDVQKVKIAVTCPELPPLEPGNDGIAAALAKRYYA